MTSPTSARWRITSGLSTPTTANCSGRPPPIWQADPRLPEDRLPPHQHQVGNLSTPVIDIDTQTMYVVSWSIAPGSPTDTVDPKNGPNNTLHRLHAINIVDGSERKPPIVIAAKATAANGSTTDFVSIRQKQRSAPCSCRSRAARRRRPCSWPVARPRSRSRTRTGGSWPSTWSPSSRPPRGARPPMAPAPGSGRPGKAPSPTRMARSTSIRAMAPGTRKRTSARASSSSPTPPRSRVRANQADRFLHTVPRQGPGQGDLLQRAGRQLR